MEENDEDLQRKLAQYGEQFMSMFDESDASDENGDADRRVKQNGENAAEAQKMQKAQKRSKGKKRRRKHENDIEGEEEEKEEEEANGRHGKKRANKSKKDDFISHLFGEKSSNDENFVAEVDDMKSRRKPSEKTTVFQFDDRTYLEQHQKRNIQHKSLDGDNNDIAVGIRDSIELKRQKHQKRQREQQEKSKMIKKLKLGEGFDVNENETMKRKTDDQKERDRLMYEAQNFVYKSTATEEEYQQFIEDQKRLQGKYSKKAKRDAKNYRELKKELETTRQVQKAEMAEAKAAGTADFRNMRKQRYIDDHKRKLKGITHIERWGAPQDEGRLDKKLRKVHKIGRGNVGIWQRGRLVLTKRDLKRMGVSGNTSK